MNDDNVEAPPMADPPQTESWIFAHFLKLFGIPNQQHSDAVEYCTSWKWALSITDQTGAHDFLKYREAFDNYKVGDMEVSGELSNICEHEQYLMLRDENKALLEQISALKEEVQKLKDQKKENEKEKSFLITEKLIEKTKVCEALNERNAKLVKDLRIQAAVDDCNTSLSLDLAKKTKECQVLNEQKIKLVEDLRIKIGVDASNASLALELRREYKLLQDINAKLADQSEIQHPAPVPVNV
ncbi:hypothetical protein GIB67_039250 [Kingdonia uniflora]|uniref:Uncharacterized protein n=1 Tax=Kingdonia uniflora TaxID=39325 RepID=A0A7J7MLY3_9MAGN|nr:hypothetical protein GIB67_039250 [Kingdonia uniflora]